MKLYFATGACGLHPQIALREAGVPFELVRVDLRAHKLSDGTDFTTINPKGYIPVLQLEDGSLLTEGAVIDQYVADLKPESRLAPRAGTIERYRLQEWLHFIGTEIHKAFSPLFNPQLDEAGKTFWRGRVSARFDLVAKALGDKPYLLGETFTVADAYLFNMLTWTDHVGIDRAKWPALAAYFARVGERPSVKESLAAERARG